jgi:hypothetical protein
MGWNMNIKELEIHLASSVHLPNYNQARYLIEKGVVIDSNMPNVDTDVLNKAIDKYGTLGQIDKAIEEMSELTKALLKERYARMTQSHLEAIDNVCEELADAVIMLNQLVLIFTERYHAFSREDLQKVVNFKIERLKGKI